jgi:hypothetical protein
MVNYDEHSGSLLGGKRFPLSFQSSGNFLNVGQINMPLVINNK